MPADATDSVSRAAATAPQFSWQDGLRVMTGPQPIAQPRRWVIAACSSLVPSAFLQCAEHGPCLANTSRHSPGPHLTLMRTPHATGRRIKLPGRARISDLSVRTLGDGLSGPSRNMLRAKARAFAPRCNLTVEDLVPFVRHPVD